MPAQHLYLAQEVTFGNYVKMFWIQGFAGDGSIVPPGKIIEITTLTLNFGRLDIAGRNAPNLSTVQQCGDFKPFTSNQKIRSI